MTVDVEIGGSVRRVELERAQDRWIATIDGRRVSVDAALSASGWSLLVAPADAGHHERDMVFAATRTAYEVAIEDRGEGDLTVFVGGHAIEAHVIDPRAFVRRGRDQGAGAHAGRRQVTAPMPGRIVKVLVKPGDHVAARQGLVVVEAMKMENELRAPGEAIVREIRATEGMSVEAGTILVILE